MMLRLGPRALELRLDVSPARDNEKRVGREERANRRAFGLRIAIADLAVHRQNQRDLGVARGALGYEIEVAQLGDIVTPELETHGLGHPEAVDIEDPTADAELRDILDHGDALE